MVTNKSQHISQQFETELQDIRSHVLAMGGLVEKQVKRALKALTSGDADLARKVIDEEPHVNAYEIKIDEECIQLIALRQPTAGDLRLVTVILKVITDLERIGDEANSIARKALNLSEQDRPKKSYREVVAMGKHVQSMLQQSLDSFARFDVNSALEVAHESTDEEYEGILRQMITYMMEDPRTISRVLDLIWSARSLERIGAHAHNISEHVIYLVEGKDVRHLSAERMEDILKEK